MSGVSGGIVGPTGGVVFISPTAYTWRADANGLTLVFTSGSAVTFTIPVGLPIGMTSKVIQQGAGQITFTAGAGVALNSATGMFTTSAQYAEVTLSSVGADNYVLGGEVSSSGGGGLVGFTSSLDTTPPNDTINVSVLQASGGTDSQSVAVVPTGQGAFSLTVPTGDSVGGNVRGLNAVDLQILPSGKNSATQVASGQNSVIAGGAHNTASSIFSTVAGGSNNSALGFQSTVAGGGGNSAVSGDDFVGGGSANTSSGGGSTVGGGSDNTASGNAAFVGGGQNNTASNTYAAVGGGVANNASGGNSTIAGGNSNTASAADSAVGGGVNNAASGAYSTVSGGVANVADGEASYVPGGLGATARGITGYGAVASGEFAIVGDAQLGVLPLRIQTTNANPTVVTSDTASPSTTNQVVLASDHSSYSFTGKVLARQATTGDSSSWGFQGLIKRGSGVGSTALVGSVTPSLIAQDAGASAWAVAITADTTNGAIAVTVTGENSKTINWLSRIETEELVA
jgi:hypothetical protein